MDDMNITYFSSSLSQTFFLAWRWKMLFLHCVLQCFMFFSEMVWSIELPFSSRKNLTFVRAETGIFYISHGWLKMCGTCSPFEVRFLLFWSFCSEVEHVIMHWRTMDEMKNAPFSSSCPQRLFEAVGRSESTIGFLTVQSQGVEDRVKTRIFMNIIGNVATSSNQATSSRIQHHPTHFTWRYYTPPPPPPPLL